MRGLVGKLEMFGYLNFEETSSLISKCYFIASSVTQVGIFTNKSMTLMKEQDPELYEEMKVQLRTLEQYYSRTDIMSEEVCDKVTKFERVENKNIAKDKIQDRINRLTRDLGGCVEYLKLIAK